MRRRAATGVLALACAVSPALALAEPTQAQDRSERNRQTVATAFDRWADGGGLFETLLAPDIVWTVEGSGPSARTYRSRDAFLAQAVRPFSERLRTPLRPLSRRIWADGDHVIVHWAGEAVARDGRAYRNRYVWILRMAGGKAVEANAFLDLPAYDDVLRRIPAAGAAP
ncbi:nuclear transport factor 2 family protein [Xanthomonas medicagonis]|uniref:nuclear transport factor 2 family protein n=1 Tax=Xanthomonas medicagonis TaxID=3160841 RepID=UPI00351576F7